LAGAIVGIEQLNQLIPITLSSMLLFQTQALHVTTSMSSIINNRVFYESILIATDCVQDEKHALLDCPSPNLTKLLSMYAPSTPCFPHPQCGPSRQRKLISQSDIKEVSLFVYARLLYCASGFKILF